MAFPRMTHVDFWRVSRYCRHALRGEKVSEILGKGHDKRDRDEWRQWHRRERKGERDYYCCHGAFRDSPKQNNGVISLKEDKLYSQRPAEVERPNQYLVEAVEHAGGRLVHARDDDHARLRSHTP